LSNPSFFTINEVAVGITTNDILCHLSGDEVRTLLMPSTLFFAFMLDLHVCVIRRIEKALLLGDRQGQN